MCWNENVSLNTFIFTSCVLIFIWYNNSYTQYKITDFDSWKVYMVYLSFTSMQLIEYFLWKSIKQHNVYNNKLFSIIGWIIIRIIQPLFLLLLLPNKYSFVKYLLFIIYSILLIAVSIYKYFYNPVNFTTVIGKNGHLSWNWIKLYNFEYIIGYLYLFIFTLLFIKFPIITLLFFIVCIYCYFNYNTTWGSMWCLICNLILMYYLCKILFILPYNEYNSLC